MNKVIKKIDSWTSFKKPIACFLIVTFEVTLAWCFLSLVFVSVSKTNSTMTIPSSVNVENNEKSLVYQLMDIEQKWGVSIGKDKATYNYDWFVQEALKIEPPNKTTQEVKYYFQKISTLMNQYFVYEASTLLTEGLAKQKIDCDLRSYLFFDIAKKAGINVSIVYSPSHAFILWKSIDQVDVLWETTAMGAGSSVNLTDSMYETAFDKSTYRVTKESEVIELYNLFTASVATDKNIELARNVIMGMADKHPDWIFPQGIKIDYLYNQENNIDRALIEETAKNLIKLEPNNTEANYVLMEYSYLRGDYEDAVNYYKGLKKNKRDFDARLIFAGSQKTNFEKIILKLDAYLYKVFWYITPYKPKDALFENQHAAFIIIIFGIWLIILIFSFANCFKSRGKEGLSRGCNDLMEAASN